MLYDFQSRSIKLESYKGEDETETGSSSIVLMNSNSTADTSASSQQSNTLFNHHSSSSSNNNSTSSSSSSSLTTLERDSQHNQYQQHHQVADVQQQLHNQLIQQPVHGSAYNHHSSTDSSYTNSGLNGIGGDFGSNIDKSFVQSLTKSVNMNVEASQHINLAPISAHGSDHQHNMHYSISSSKNLTNSSPSSLALNFSHDLLQSGHHSSSNNNHSSLHHHSSDSTPTTSSVDIKHNHNQNNSVNPFDLDSGSLMQSAAAGMWKNTMNLSHFKHSTMAEHSFLPTSDMNTTFSTWAHGNNMGHHHHQTAQQMTHHILDGPHLISYPQHHHHHHHQRSSLPTIPNQSDLVGASLKSQQSCADQATTFMLNSINHQTNASNNHIPITTATSHHHHHNTTQQPHDTLNIRSQPLDHGGGGSNGGGGGSYNLADNQFYGSSRSENRSHTSGMKPSVLMTDKPMQLSLSNHQASQLHHYPHATTNNGDHPSPQPTTSHQHMPGSSHTTSSTSSRNIGNFRCQHCDQVFTMRNLYQSHLKTHSREKGAKAKFQCELCGHSFSQKTSLNRHMKSHTGERPFPCEVCGKAFSEKERLKIHMRTHTGEKPFSCGICGKSFSQKSTVKRHQTVHTGEKKFKCDCGKGFANRGNLIAHIKTRGSNHFE